MIAHYATASPPATPRGGRHASAKERFFKAAFGEVKAFFDFDAVELEGIDGARHLLHCRCAQALSAHLPERRMCQAQFALLDDGSVLTAVVLRR